MAPMVVNQPRTIVISPAKLAMLENRNLIDNAELPKYAVGLFESNGPGPRKRKRLTHLTPEEKIMRRKLKNRVAAQTARDRKKARLETLEETVAKIHEQAKLLLDVNSQLLARTEELEKENEVLRKRLGLEGDCSYTQNKRQELMEIKDEFNSIVSQQNIMNRESVKNDSSDDEPCILTPYEPESVVSDRLACVDDGEWEASKCGSPEPAASGERLFEGRIPQQQEAVKSMKLIHLQTKHNQSSTQTPLSCSTPMDLKVKVILPSSSVNSVIQSRPKSSHLTKVKMEKEVPLDLRI